MSNKKYVYGFIVLAVITTLAVAVPVLAQTTPTTQTPGAWSNGNYAGGMMNRGNRPMMKSCVFGTVSGINGNTITVTSTKGPSATVTTTTTYTVDATNAKIMKNNIAGTVSSIVVGDTVMVQGTVNGTNVVATTIRDGQLNKGMRGGLGSPSGNQLGTSPITGTGQPIVAGTVSSISGSTIMITNKSNVSYTVDATNAKIVQGQNTILPSNIAVGDMVVIQGTVNGNSVTASSIIDQNKPVSTTTTSGNTEQQHQGFFGSIGSFFARIFGF